MDKTPSSVIQYQEIKDFLKPLRMFGMPVVSVAAPAALNVAKDENITFCNKKGHEALSLLTNCHAGIILCRDDIPELETTKFLNCILTVSNPRLAFMQCLNEFFTPAKPVGIHPTAIIDEGVSIPSNVYIGPQAHLCKGVRIGEGSVIEDRVYIAPNTIIGANVYIQVGAVIGCEGQGFERTVTGEFEKFIQLGSVIIEDGVEIGANSTIVRGTFSNTQIGQGTKIGHQVNIGHNVKIGRHVFISANAIVCGSAIVGDYSWLAPSCCIRNKVFIGKKVTVGLGTVVVKDVVDGITVVGVPAKDINLHD